MSSDRVTQRLIKIWYGGCTLVRVFTNSDVDYVSVQTSLDGYSLNRHRFSVQGRSYVHSYPLTVRSRSGCSPRTTVLLGGP